MRIAIPIEIKNRELKGKIWLALKLIENNHEVILGEMPSIRDNCDVFNPDMLFYTGLPKEKSVIKNFRNLQKKGVKISILETEGGVFYDDESFVNERSSNSFINDVELYFCWGEKQANLLKNNTKISGNKVIVSGNPRFDLLRNEYRSVYQKEVDEIKDDFGKYILIPTTFTIANHPKKAPSRFEKELIDYQSNLISEYISMIKKLSEYLSNTTIIVRPHPAEKESTYMQEFHHIDNVDVISSGESIPWIMGSELVIHKDSTTGIESFMLDTPVFSYNPIRNDKYDADLPIMISDEYDKYLILQEKIINCLKKDIHEVATDNYHHDIIKKYITNISGEPAVNIITKNLNVIPEAEEIQLQRDLSYLQKLKRTGIKYIGEPSVESIGKRVFNSDHSTARQKFPKLTQQELRSEMSKFNNFVNVPLDEIKIYKIDGISYSFVISSRKQ